ncbi:hypothetical protein SASPL_147404 [Salvia splendens]|uniref:Uncharacterized protein n=1 Tax=Salvia splendens TaxID=180675 RepID=A0A8X8WF40_SALSN|nr:hypothetical protein SASPL_147404 [Salvia splendens]
MLSDSSLLKRPTLCRWKHQPRSVSSSLPTCIRYPILLSVCKLNIMKATYSNSEIPMNKVKMMVMHGTDGSGFLFILDSFFLDGAHLFLALFSQGNQQLHEEIETGNG